MDATGLQLLGNVVLIEQCNNIDQPEAEGKHPILFQESASGIHQGRLELRNPSNNIGQSHLYSWQPEATVEVDILQYYIHQRGQII